MMPARKSSKSLHSFARYREERVQKACKLLRRYLLWVQNSVFEGDLTEAQLERLRRDLLWLLDPDYDAVLIYRFQDRRWVTREALGCEKLPMNKVL